MHENRAPLPSAFCWTRFGPEAGEPFEAILNRKEAERRAGDATFYWGIGSAIRQSLKVLISTVDEPEVLFSPIAGSPRQCDVSPESVVRWTEGEALTGERVAIPPHALVTSRWDPARPGLARYALVCRSHDPLRLHHHGDLNFSALRNIGTGTRLGASQVTAVVCREKVTDPSGRIYRVALRASLAWPYLVRLAAPEVLEVASLGAETDRRAAA